MMSWIRPPEVPLRTIPEIAHNLSSFASLMGEIRRSAIGVRGFSETLGLERPPSPQSRSRVFSATHELKMRLYAFPQRTKSSRTIDTFADPLRYISAH